MTVATESTPVFEAHGLEKVYRMGEVEVHALRGVDLVLYAGVHSVEARVVLTDHDDVLLAPTSALVRRGSGWAVFVVADARAVLRSVKVGGRNADQAEVLDGLRVGETVVAQPSDRVREGVPSRS